MDFPTVAFSTRSYTMQQDMVDIAWTVVLTEMDQTVRDVEKITICEKMVTVYLVTATWWGQEVSNAMRMENVNVTLES